jgi:zinc protease
VKRSAFLMILISGIIQPVLCARPVIADPPPSSTAPAAPSTPVPLRETLPGGLHLIVEERPGSPLTAIEIRARVGSGSETPQNNGIAHAIEHMLFRGSEARDPGAIDREIERLGGELTARTTRDDTKFATVVPSGKWREALGLVAELLETPKFAPEQWEREKAVIRAEMAVARTDPARSGFAQVATVVYAPSDPYSLPLMGTPDTLARLTADDLRAFWKEGYRPANLTVVLVGDVKPADAKRLVAGLFPVLADAPEVTPRPSVTVFSSIGSIVRAPDLPPAAQPERDLVTMQFAFRAPAAHEGDTLPVMDTLMAVLSVGGRYGRLAERLIEKDRVALTIAADFLPGKTGSLILFTATAQPKDAAALQKAVEEELSRLREDPLMPAEVEAARADTIGRFRYDSETVAGRANRLAQFDLYAPRWTEKTYLERIEKISDTDLRQAILRYLTPGSYAVSVIGPPVPMAVETSGGEVVP